MQQIPANNLLHLGAVGVGAWGAWNVAKGRTGLLQYAALAAGAWGLWRFSQYGWVAAPAGAALPSPAPGAVTQLAPQTTPTAAPTAPGTYNPWEQLGAGLGQLSGAIYDLATGEQTGVGTGYPGYGALPYEAPPPGYG